MLYSRKSTLVGCFVNFLLFYLYLHTNSTVQGSETETETESTSTSGLLELDVKAQYKSSEPIIQKKLSPLREDGNQPKTTLINGIPSINHESQLCDDNDPVNAISHHKGRERCYIFKSTKDAIPPVPLENQVTRFLPLLKKIVIPSNHPPTLLGNRPLSYKNNPISDGSFPGMPKLQPVSALLDITGNTNHPSTESMNLPSIHEKTSVSNGIVSSSRTNKVVKIIDSKAEKKGRNSTNNLSRPSRPITTKKKNRIQPTKDHNPISKSRAPNSNILNISKVNGHGYFLRSFKSCAKSVQYNVSLYSTSKIEPERKLPIFTKINSFTLVMNKVSTFMALSRTAFTEKEQSIVVNAATEWKRLNSMINNYSAFLFGMFSGYLLYIYKTRDDLFVFTCSKGKACTEVQFETNKEYSINLSTASLLLTILRFKGTPPEFTWKEDMDVSNFHTLIKNQLVDISGGLVPFFIHERKDSKSVKKFKLDLDIKNVSSSKSIRHDWKNEVDAKSKEYECQSYEISYSRDVTYEAKLHSPFPIEHNDKEMIAQSKTLTLSITKEGVFAILKTKIKNPGQEAFLPNSRDPSGLIPLINNNEAIVIGKLFKGYTQLFKGTQMENPYRLFKCRKGSQCEEMSFLKDKKSQSTFPTSSCLLFIPPLEDYSKLKWEKSSTVQNLGELVGKTIEENYGGALPFLSITSQ